MHACISRVPHHFQPSDIYSLLFRMIFPTAFILTLFLTGTQVAGLAAAQPEPDSEVGHDPISRRRFLISAHPCRSGGPST